MIRNIILKSIGIVAMLSLIGCSGGSSTQEDTAIKILDELLIGTTQYTINTNGVATDKLFNENGTYTSAITLVNGRVIDASGNYTIEGNVLTLNRTAPTSTTIVATYVSHESDVIVLAAAKDGGEAFDTFFYTDAGKREEKAHAIISNL